jgi:hypothetical protein
MTKVAMAITKALITWSRKSHPMVGIVEYPVR